MQKKEKYAEKSCQKMGKSGMLFTVKISKFSLSHNLIKVKDKQTDFLG